MADQDKPAKVAFDLGKFEKEAQSDVDPFVVKMPDGKRIEFVDWQRIPWRPFLDAEMVRQQTGDPEPALRLIVPDDEHDKFFAYPLTMGGLAALMREYMEHYGVDPSSIAAQ